MKKEALFSFLFYFLISLLFFYPILKGFIALPTDLLVGEFEPYKSYQVLGYAPGGVPNKAQGADVIRQVFPWKFFSIEQLKKREIPLWNPYNISGNPLMANLQSGVFYPFNLLFFIAPFLFSWNLYILLQPILAGFFTYLFLREIKISKSASFFGGFIFAFSGFGDVWIEYGVLIHTLLWLPLVLWLILRFLKKPDIMKLIFLTFILTFSIFAGYIQMAIYLYIFASAFLIVNFIKEKDKLKVWKTYAGIMFLFIASLLLASIQLLPAIQLFQNSARSVYTFNQLSERLMPLANIVTFVIPDFFGNPASRNYWLPGTYIERVMYIGISPFIFILFSFHAKKYLYKTFFSIAALFIFLSMLDIYPVKFFHSLGIPLLSTGVPTRAGSVFVFCICILSAVGFDHWQKNQDTRKYLKSFILLLFIFAGIWFFTFLNHNTNYLITRRNLVLPTILLILSGLIIFGKFYLEYIFKKLQATFLDYKNLLIILIFCIVFFDLFYFFQKITPFTPKEFFYPQTKVFTKIKEIQGIDRTWGYGTASINSNIETYEKVFSSSGYEPLYIKRYGELISSSKDGKIATEISRSTADIFPGFGKDDLKDNYYRQRILNLLGVKYILAKKDQAFPDGLYNPIWEDEKFRIYENKNIVPRVNLYGSYVVESDKNKIINLIFDKNFNLNKTLILEENLPDNFNIQPGVGSQIKILDYSPNKIVLNSNSSSDTLLFLSDNYYSGWRASVDGTESKIYRADYSFRALPVQSGTHQIIFWYNPQTFSLGLKISVATFCAILLFIAVNIIKRKYV